ncbi:DUF6064 family protein [Puniceicoccus vermicola]|uniref:MFS transporter permease n=1 Tax=Puniceicoccus vermicola TaxID=388746 RepID=A0A7X1AZX6_9BACT|nr:hypothetical protein [Puniceicoccus vermicola]
MISELQTYALSDFIPFSREVYESLIAYYNEQIWPLQILFLAVAAVLLISIAVRSKRNFLLPGIFLAFAWWWTGLVYLQQYLLQILPQAQWASALFVIQGTACLIPALGPGNLQITRQNSPRFWTGCGLYALASILPIGILLGNPFNATTLWGWGPTETALGTLGILLITQGSPIRWLLVIIPIVWLVFTAVLHLGLQLHP